MDLESVANLSTRQKAQKFGSMDQRSYQESIKEKPKNLDGSRIYQEKEKEGLDRRESVEDLSRSCRA